jgi:hypothetical protein
MELATVWATFPQTHLVTLFIDGRQFDKTRIKTLLLTNSDPSMLRKNSITQQM